MASVRLCRSSSLSRRLSAFATSSALEAWASISGMCCRCLLTASLDKPNWRAMARLESPWTTSASFIRTLSSCWQTEQLRANGLRLLPGYPEQALEHVHVDVSGDQLRVLTQTAYLETPAIRGDTPPQQ